MRELGEKFYLSCQAGVVDNGKLYVIDCNYSMLLEYDLKDFSYSVLSYRIIPTEFQKCKVIAMFKRDNILYIVIDGSMGNVIKYDLLSNNYINFHQDESDTWKDIWYSYNGEDTIYIFPLLMKYGFFTFDIEKKEFHENMLIKKNGEIFTEQNNDSWGRLFVKGRKMFAFTLRQRIITLFDEEKECCEYDLGDISIENVGYYEDNFYISSFDDEMIREWNSDKGIIAEYPSKKIARDVNSSVRIFNIYAEEKGILCVPRVGAKLSFIDKTSGEEVEIDSLRYCSHVRKTDGLFFTRGKIIGERVLLLPHEVDCFLWVDMTSGDIESVSCELKNEDVCIADLIHNIEKNGFMKEQKENEFGAFVQLVGKFY